MRCTLPFPYPSGRGRSEIVVEPGMHQTTNGRHRVHIADRERFFVAEEFPAKDELGRIGYRLDVGVIEHQRTIGQPLDQIVTFGLDHRRVDGQAVKARTFTFRRHEECRVGVERIAELAELGGMQTDFIFQFGNCGSEMGFARIQESARQVPHATALVGPILFDHQDEQVPAADDVRHDDRTAAAVFVEVPRIIAADVAIFQGAETRIGKFQMFHVLNDFAVDFDGPATLGLIFDVIRCHVNLLSTPSLGQNVRQYTSSERIRC